MDHDIELDALDRAYAGVSRFAAGLSATDLLAGTRCHGWVVADVLFHLLNDAQRALIAFASPAHGPADRDHVTYWSGFAEEAALAGDSLTGLWAIKRSAAAFREGMGAVMLWHETAPAAVRAAARADGFVSTQGHVLAVSDFLATLTTEAVIHHLDMSVHLAGAPAPDPAAIAVATRTLDGLLAQRAPGASRPADWTPEAYLLRATGRAPVTGALADVFPLLR